MTDENSLDATSDGTREDRPAAMAPLQAACYIGISRSFLAVSRMDGDRANRTPGPPFLKIGKKVLYLRADLDEWLLKHRIQPGRSR